MSLLEDDSKQMSWHLPGAILLAVIVISVAIWMIIGRSEFDKVTLCEVGVKSKQSIILFDKTGGFSENQKRILAKAIEKEISELNVGDRLAIYEIEPTRMNGLSEPVFDKCKPRDGSDADALFENDRLMQKVFTQQFGDIVAKVTDEMISAEAAKTSPIIESLQDISSISSLDSSVTLKRVILISDLLQHSDALSFYRSSPNDHSPMSIQSQTPDLFGIDIQVYWLLRNSSEKNIQNSGLMSWWEHLFETANAQNFSVMKVR